MKRRIDFLAFFRLLIPLAPVMTLQAIRVWIDAKSVLFRQEHRAYTDACSKSSSPG